MVREWYATTKEFVMKRIAVSLLVVCAVCAGAFAQTSGTAPRSYYVSASGDDSNNGRSEQAPFKTLGRAAEAAGAGVIKTITVIGTVGGGYVHVGEGGDDEILVTGKPNANEAEKAVITGNDWQSLHIRGNVRFTHIRLTRGGLDINGVLTLGADVVFSNLDTGDGEIYLSPESTLVMTDNATIADYSVGSGHSYRDNSKVIMSGNATITNSRAVSVISVITVIMSGNAKVSNNRQTGVNARNVTMSENAEISGNGGYGVSSGEGSVILSGNARIINNGGGVNLRESTLSLSGNARISNNTTRENGGGVYLTGKCTITLSGNAVISGNAAKNGGGVFLHRGYGDAITTLTLEGGGISGNKAEYGAGVYVNGDGCTFTHKGGTVTGNEAEFVGGGVYVRQGGNYNAQGGTVTGNTAGDGGANVFRQ